MVGSRKNKANAWLPPRVYRGKSSYEWQPKNGSGRALCKKPKDGLETESIKREVWRKYEEAINKVESRGTIADLAIQYFASTQFRRLSGRTQEDYRRYHKKIETVFGAMLAERVKPVQIRAFMDKLGAQKPVTANRHHSFLSVLFSWADERGLVDGNPAKRVKKFPETARVRYIEHFEYQIVHECAKQSPYPYISPMMEIAYLCRARSNEVRMLNESDIGEKGIYLKRTKGSKDELTLWTPRLKAAVEFARSLYPDSPTPTSRPLFRGKNGTRLVDSSRKTAWGRIMKTALSEGAIVLGTTKVLGERFTFHDIKAKGVSDHENHHSGHKSERMKDVYIRKVDEIKATD